MTESHVEECLGINGKGKVLSVNSGEGFTQLCKDLGGSKGFVQIKGLAVYLLSTKVADEEFKRKFALYILGSFLCPTTKPAVHESLIHLVSDVGAMENVNWARITLEFLCKSILGQRSNNRVHANGCLFLLLVFYLERVSPTTFEMPRRNPCLVVWGDREIKDVLRNFKKIGGYKERVSVIFMRDENTGGNDSRSHEIINPDVADMKDALKSVVSLLERQNSVLERQTSVFERFFGSQVGNKQPEVAVREQEEMANNHKVPSRQHHVQFDPNMRSPYTGGRMSTPRFFPTHDGVVEPMKGQGDGIEDKKYGPIFPANEYAGPENTPHGKTPTRKRNYEDCDDDPAPFSPSPSPLTGFKPRVKLSRGRKQKIINTNLRRSLRLDDYELPQLRPRAELRKSQLISSPYTGDGWKKRIPAKKHGAAQSPILLDDENLDVQFVPV